MTATTTLVALHLPGGRHLLDLALRVAHRRPDVVAVAPTARPQDWPGPWVQADPSDDLVEIHRRIRALPAIPGASDAHARPAAEIVSNVLGEPGRWDDEGSTERHAAARSVIACWPPHVGADAWHAPGADDRVHYVGGVSRFSDRRPPATGEHGRVLFVTDGPVGPSVPALLHLRHARPDLTLRVAGRLDGQQGDVDGITVLGPTEDLWDELVRAEIVVSTGTLGIVNDVAAARRPLLVLPQPRPHDQERMLGAALDHHRLAVVGAPDPDGETLADLVEDARGHGQFWDEWDDGRGFERLTRLL